MLTCSLIILRPCCRLKCISVNLPKTQMAKPDPTGSAECICSCFDALPPVYNDIFTYSMIYGVFFFFFSLQLRRLDASLLFVQSFFSVLCFWMRHQQSRHVQASSKSLATYQIKVGCWSDDKKKNRMLFNKFSSYRKRLYTLPNVIYHCFLLDIALNCVA